LWKWFFSWDQLRLYAFRLDREEVPLVEPQEAVKLVFIDGGKNRETYDLFEVTEATSSQQRLREGGMVCVAVRENRIASYCWVAFEKAHIGEIGRDIRIRPDEVYLYDAFTLSAFRGRGLYPTILSSILRHVQERRKFQRAMIFTLLSNQASIRGIERCGFHFFQVVTAIQLLGRPFPLYGRLKEGERDVDFRNSQNRNGQTTMDQG